MNFQGDYAYFSSVSQSWLDHAARYAGNITQQLGLSQDSFVIEVASNDGYLLRNFVAANIPCLGIEPTADTAEAAGKSTFRFFVNSSVRRLPNSSGVRAGRPTSSSATTFLPMCRHQRLHRWSENALKPGGTITLEFPHLMRLIEHTQFDTVYHEHYSYLSLYTVNRIFGQPGCGCSM